jgi:uncharacterized protein YbjT (DUF2867 family)
MPRIAVCGATGRTGRRLIQHLLATGRTVAAIGRNAVALARLDARAERRLADLDDRATLTAALGDADVIVSCVPPRFVPSIIAAAPRGLGRLVVMGSTRKFSRYGDGLAAEVLAAEAALKASGLPHVVLHPTLIYGTGEDWTVERILAYLRRIPVLPLPGGSGLVQPIHVDDVVRALDAAIRMDEPPKEGIVIAGPTPMSYAAMIRELARSRRLTALVVTVPMAPLLLLARLGRVLPFLPSIEPAELRRLGEDKSFDIQPMRERLGVAPISFAEGVRLGADRPDRLALPQGAD